MDSMKEALADFVFTAMWFFFATWFSGLAVEIGTAFEVPSPIILVVVLFLFLCVFKLITDAMGGASNNPIDIVSLYTASPGVDDYDDGSGLIPLAIRLPAQAVGAAFGTLAIMEVLPLQYRYMLTGPSLNVDIHTGAIVEFLLAFVYAVAILWIVKGPQKMIVQMFFTALTIATLSVAGHAYTGSAVNPAQAFGWAYVHKWHKTWEHFYVYWICPLVGAILAAKTFLILFPAPPAVARTRPRATNKKKKT